MSKQPANNDIEMGGGAPESKYLGNESKSYNEPAPSIGFEFVPAEDVVPKPVLLNKLIAGLLDKLNEAGSQYTGDLNAEGLRHGSGKLVYIDGSVYNGAFKNGQRDGYGELTLKDGTLYKGQWKNGKKHGEGKLIHPDGNIIQTVWNEDKKDGHATLTTKDGKIVEAEYFNDLMVKKDDQNPDCWHLAPLNIILGIIVWAMGYWTFNNDYSRRAHGYVVGVWIFFILFYLLECGLCKTNGFIRNVMRAHEAQKILDNLKNEAPKVSMRLENYHYEFVRRNHRYDYTQRTSSIHTRDFRYSEFIDQSANPSSVSHMKKYKLTRLDLILDIQYTAQASQSKVCQEYNLKKEKISDTHHDLTVTSRVEGFTSEILVHNGELGESLPFYCNSWVYWITHLLFIGWIVRILFVSNSQRVSYTVEKVILK
ncbi:2-isopropylmalate synthase [Stylonychia lemnae]|uniref:2-isopropylmalate synthase n=1 Tax=Stylonychia lemnae TaxID=5949 RepID=A0A078AWH0_STYLE|nr:2-isopropylmalate synthase [Stylonychia lemnae]|eukprot:CDW86499.1 2-isopropylmalate synthase [Stylonychia lemnae]